MEPTKAPTEEELPYTLERAFQIFASKQEDWAMPHDPEKPTGNTEKCTDVSG